jgi:hypothetical protein
MPTTIALASGPSAGTEFWVEETVSRIGSDPHCQLCVADADLPPHVATLEFRGGEFLLHNRHTMPLLLNGREVPPRGSARWPAGQVLQLTETLTLRLETNGDPAPSPRPVAALPEQLEEPPPADEENSSAGQPGEGTEKSSKKLLPLVVTVLCVVVGGLLLLKEPSGQENAPVRNVPRDFERLITELGKEGAPAGLDADEVRSALQAARMAQLRGDRSRAQGYYAYLRDLLLERRRPDGSFSSKLEEYLWEFVGGQLRSRPSAAGEQTT